MRYTLEFIGSAEDCKLQTTDFLIALLLELSNLNKKLIIANALITDILLKLDVASLKLLASLTHMFDSSLINIYKMSFRRLKFTSVTIPHVSQLLSIISFKLSSQIV
jgi:hypothetical protein